MNLQARLKAVTAFATTTVAMLVGLYQQYQNVTLKAVVAAVVAGLLGGLVVHQVPNKVK